MIRTKKQFAILTVISIFVVFAAFILSLYFGAEKIAFKDFFNAIVGKGPEFKRIILWKLRLPRSLLVLLTGILLGGSGAVFQLFFRNPLAEPGIMGISSGATLGAVIAGALGLGTGLSASASVFNFWNLISPVNLAAFCGAILAGSLVTFLAFTKAGSNSSVMLLLCGTALGTLYSSISSIILLGNNKELHSLYSWILGSFNGRGWKELIFILIPSAISILIMLVIARPLDLLSFGETSAKSVGVEVDKIRILVLISGSLAVSAGVCAGGTIGFVGLIAPHIVRKIAGPNSKTLIPFSMIFGACILLLSDTIARVIISPAELPTGIITSLLGVPFFLWLCLKK